MAGRTRTHRGKDYTVSGAHPHADTYDWLSEDALQALADDIKAHGLRKKIERCNGVVVDGRNRELACLVAGVRPVYADISADTPDAALVALIDSANEHRRHDSPEAVRRRKAERVGRVVKAREEGKSLRAIAEVEQVSPEQVRQDLITATVKGLTVETPSEIKGLDGKTRPATRPEPEPEDEPEESGDWEPTGGDLEEIDNGDPPEMPPELQPLNGSLPVPSHDASKQAAPAPWKPPESWKGGSKVDPDHPFAALLNKLSAVSGEITRLFKTEQGKILLWVLSDLAKLRAKVRYVLFKNGVMEKDEDGELRGVAGRFVGLYPLRSILKKAGLMKRKPTPKQIQKWFFDAIEADETDILEAEGW